MTRWLLDGKYECDGPGPYKVPIYGKAPAPYPPAPMIGYLTVWAKPAPADAEGPDE